MAQEQKQAAEQCGLQPTGTSKRKWESVTLSLDDEVRAALKRGAAVHGSPNKALRAVLLLIWGAPAPPGTVIHLSPDYVHSDGRIAPGDRAIVGDVAGYNDAPDVTTFEEEKPLSVRVADRVEQLTPSDTRPKNATCRHCGNRFAGPKYATVCNECLSKGHVNINPAECGECTAGQGI